MAFHTFPKMPGGKAGHLTLTALHGGGEFLGSTWDFPERFSHAHEHRYHLPFRAYGFFHYFTGTLEASNSYKLPVGTCALACPPGRGTSLLSVPLQPFEGSRAAMRPARGFAARLPAPEPHGKPSGESSQPRASTVVLFAFFHSRADDLN